MHVPFLHVSFCVFSPHAVETPSRPRLCALRIWPDFQGYGFNLHAEKGKPGQFIGKVDAGSPSEVAGLKEGDRILEVNGNPVAQDSHAQVVQKIKSRDDQTDLLVVDKEADEYYKDRGIVVDGGMSDVERIECPVVRPEGRPYSRRITRLIHFQANTRRLTNADLTLAQRRRRWTNVKPRNMKDFLYSLVKPTLIQRVV